MGRPFQTWRCIHSPPSMAWIIPARREMNSRYRGELSGAFGATNGAVPAHLQATTPSVSAGGGGVISPKKSVQRSGYESGCVAVATQPPATGVASVIVTPGEVR